MRSLPGVILALLLAASAAATSLVGLDLDQLAQRADLVLVGRVDGARTQRDTGLGLIVTVTRIEPIRVVAGSASELVEVVTLGGHDGGIGQIVDGEAEFVRGETVAVFLRPAAAAAGGSSAWPRASSRCTSGRPGSWSSAPAASRSSIS